MPTAYSARAKNAFLILGGLAAGFMNGLLAQAAAFYWSLS